MPDKVGEKQKRTFKDAYQQRVFVTVVSADFSRQPTDSGFNLLFSEDKHEDAFNLSEFNALQANDIEYKVNENYMLNGLHNAKFHHKEITPEKLDKIINRYQSRKVILFGERLDHLVETITHAANKHKADMIIAPFIQQEESESYKDDPIIRLIRKHIDIRKEKNNSKIIDPSSTPESRAYTAMQQYYALKAASSLGAKVYRESKLTRNFPFNKPTHYVSTIEI